MKNIITSIYDNAFPATDVNNTKIREQLNYIGIDKQVEIARIYLDSAPNTNPNAIFNLQIPLINIAGNAFEEEKTSGVNDRNTSNGFNENQLYGPNDKRGSYPIINGF